MATKNTKKTQTQQPEAEKPVQQALKSKEIVYVAHINAIDLYNYSSQEVLEAADKAYALYGQTPTIQVSGEVLIGGAIIRLKSEQGIYKDVVDDSWHCPLLGIDMLPLNGVFSKVRVGIHKGTMLQDWEETQERKTYRAKLLDGIKK